MRSPLLSSFHGINSQQDGNEGNSQLLSCHFPTWRFQVKLKPLFPAALLEPGPEVSCMFLEGEIFYFLIRLCKPQAAVSSVPVSWGSESAQKESGFLSGRLWLKFSSGQSWLLLLWRLTEPLDLELCHKLKAWQWQNIRFGCHVSQKSPWLLHVYSNSCFMPSALSSSS